MDADSIIFDKHQQIADIKANNPMLEKKSTTKTTFLQMK
jgi:hypothetical protein